MTVAVAGIIGRAVQRAIIAFLACILDSVSTFLGRRTIVVALVEDKYAIAVHFAIDDVAVVTDLAVVDDAVAAAADVDADWLIGGALLPRPTESATTQRLQCGIPARSTRDQ